MMKILKHTAYGDITSASGQSTHKNILQPNKAPEPIKTGNAARKENAVGCILNVFDLRCQTTWSSVKLMKYK